MIKKIGGKYAVLSETTGRKFGTYKTKTEALKRLRQIEFFKLKGGPSVPEGPPFRTPQNRCVGKHLNKNKKKK